MHRNWDLQSHEVEINSFLNIHPRFGAGMGVEAEVKSRVVVEHGNRGLGRKPEAGSRKQDQQQGGRRG